MCADFPKPEQIPALRQLWQEAFGDEDAFLDKFFSTAYSPNRCRVILSEGQAAAALYWLDCLWEGKKLAYLYAVATAKAFQGRGLCRLLLEDTHALLAQKGYAGVVLCPGNDGLFAMYAKLGYVNMSAIREFSAEADDTVCPLTKISPEEYARRRKILLPPNSILQEGESLAFLTTFSSLYAGQDCLLCARREEDTLFVPEILGNTDRAAGVLGYFGCKTGIFRTPGLEKPFAMYHRLTADPTIPAYLGHAFD